MSSSMTDSSPNTRRRKLEEQEEKVIIDNCSFIADFVKQMANTKEDTISERARKSLMDVKGFLADFVCKQEGVSGEEPGKLGVLPEVEIKSSHSENSSEDS